MFLTPFIKERDVPRNIDLTALRSFVAVAEAGGVTRAAGLLNVTQSAVSMQLKRLEEGLGLSLLDRSQRGVTLTAAGEQLLGYGRRLLALNDEVYARLTDQEFEGEIAFGVPSDIVYPHIPRVLRRFHEEYPRVRVQLISSYTRALRRMLARGEAQVILTTETGCDPGGETLAQRRLVWVGARDGQAYKARPLRLAFEINCIFRNDVQEALDAAGIPWEMAVESETTRAVEASVSADLAVHAALEDSAPPYLVPIAHGGALPELPAFNINMYAASIAPRRARGADAADLPSRLADLVRRAWAG